MDILYLLAAPKLGNIARSHHIVYTVIDNQARWEFRTVDGKASIV